MPKRVLLPPPPAAYFRGPLTAYNHTHRCTTCGVAAHSASQANGNGWPAVNQAPFDRLDVRPTDLPILVPQPADLSPRAASVFTSEFGASAFSSFESMAPTLAQEHWGVHGGAPVDNCEEPDKTNGFWKVCKGGNVMAERNYPCDNLIIGYFGTGQQLDLTGEVAFKRQLYQCMVAQALAIKSNIEQKRAANKFGIVTWQLNEIWPTGGWGSIEYVFLAPFSLSLSLSPPLLPGEFASRSAQTANITNFLKFGAKTQPQAETAQNNCI